MNDDDYKRRALAAYYKTGGNVQPTEPERVDHDGLAYVVLHNHTETLAVYRVTNQLHLKRLKRWPAGVTEGLVG